MCCFFFFQAEDGIRDADVTGVQTCALPISVGGRDAGLEGDGEGRSGDAAERLRGRGALVDRGGDGVAGGGAPAAHELLRRRRAGAGARPRAPREAGRGAAARGGDGDGAGAPGSGEAPGNEDDRRSRQGRLPAVLGACAALGVVVTSPWYREDRRELVIGRLAA